MAYRNRVADAADKTGRRLRRPSHPFQIRTKFWQLQPFLIAPVLPAETMKNAMFMSRVVSDPMDHRLLGAHKEYWLFYVRLRDLTGAADFEEMMLNPSKDMSAYVSAASATHFHSYGVNYTKLALDKIVEHYFRADDETIADSTINGTPGISHKSQSWLDSMIPNSQFAPVQDVDVDANADGTITVSEIDTAQRDFALMRQMGLTSMDFDDYLRTFGIRVAPAESDKPELLRYVSEWTYPVNTVEPTTGVPSTALSWSLSDRADKDRFFKEPGFIIGVTATRPKIYLGNQKGSVTGLMSNALRWLPAIMSDDAYTSLIQIETAANGPLQNQTEGYVFDIRDLFLYGEQYINFATSTPNTGMLAMPEADGDKRYPTEAMSDALFKATENSLYIWEDGVINLSILGNQKDTTPQVRAIGI